MKTFKAYISESKQASFNDLVARTVEIYKNQTSKDLVKASIQAQQELDKDDKWNNSGIRTAAHKIIFK